MLLVAFEQIYPSSRYILDVWGMGSFVVGLLWTFWSFWLFFFLFFWRFSSSSFFGECSYVSFLMFWLVFVFVFILF